MAGCGHGAPSTSPAEASPGSLQARADFVLSRSEFPRAALTIALPTSPRNLQVDVRTMLDGLAHGYTPTLGIFEHSSAVTVDSDLDGHVVVGSFTPSVHNFAYVDAVPCIGIADVDRSNVAITAPRSHNALVTDIRIPLVAKHVGNCSLHGTYTESANDYESAFTVQVTVNP